MLKITFISFVLFCQGVCISQTIHSDSLLKKEILIIDTISLNKLYVYSSRGKQISGTDFLWSNIDKVSYQPIHMGIILPPNSYIFIHPCKMYASISRSQIMTIFKLDLGEDCESGCYDLKNELTYTKKKGIFEAESQLYFYGLININFLNRIYFFNEKNNLNDIWLPFIVPFCAD